ncbi:hypothetical protein FKG94_28580 [Exilibacterium tricleocarpae]|uniref:Uncharacterized protein n=1 Tax=Exilibacterium tricleocarpae TaxID=2591008 RepID=A0A545SKQ7_9GAMM|nr:hypothetical protein [Exilibacterium tricleocarpae]TQV65567.1 hypothetical protein FKG94_28580 [Exilibacterium tricleocarpae]
MYKIANYALLLMMPLCCQAGKVTSKITHLAAATVQYGTLTLETPASTKPTCADEYTIMSFDKTTSHGRDMYSMALAALTAQLRLSVTYSDTECGLYGTRAVVTRLDIYAR